MKNRIEYIPKYSALLCIMVVLIHNSIPAYFTYGNSQFADVIHYILIKIIPKVTEVAVPSFFALSGFLFYRNFDVNKIGEKYRSRFYSLVIPYIIFNSIGYISELFAQIPFFSSLASYHSTPYEISNIFYGIFLHKYTILWFIFALIVYSYSCPILFQMVRNKFVGLFCIVVLGVLISFGYIDIKLPGGLYFESTSLIYYLVGAYLGCNFKSCYSTDITKCMAFVSLLALIILVFVNCMVEISPVWDILLIIVKSISLWCLIKFFSPKIKNRNWYSITFFIYLTFLPIIRLISGMLRFFVKYFSLRFDGLELLLYVMTVVCTIYICIALSVIWKSVSIKSFKYVTGNRG